MVSIPYIQIHAISLQTCPFHTFQLFNVHISHLLHNDSDPFWSYHPICGKYIKWPQNDLEMLKVTNTHMHTTYTVTRGPNFVSFILPCYDVQFPSYSPKSALYDPKLTLTCSRSKYPRAYYICPFYYISLFFSVSLYDEPFRVTAQFWESAPSDPKMTLTCASHKVPHMYQYCINDSPERKFSSISHYDEPTSSYNPTL